MRLRPLVVGFLAAVGLAACAGERAGGPLALEQRVLTEAEVPGSAPDPVETQRTGDSEAELTGIMEDHLITITEEDGTRLEDDGLLAAILDTRFIPEETGGEHPPPDGPVIPHVRSLVLQFDSETGAADAVDLLIEDGLEPCPETCAFDIAEFEVSGIPNATGVYRIATQESLDRVGDTEGRPIAEYTIRFADGVFGYDITLFGPPDDGDISEQHAEDIVKKLYERVQGLRAPSG